MKKLSQLKLIMSSAKGLARRQAGFTLVELLVVIAVLGILSVGLIVTINPIDKLNSASDSRVLGDIGALARASESYATARNGFYPSSIASLVTAGELKVAPTAPSGYAYTYTALPAACTAGTTCTSITITAPLKSNKYTVGPPIAPFVRYESATGKQCQVATAATACP